MKDLDAMHPDGSVLHATKVYHVTLQDYRIALRRFTRYLLDGELWDVEGTEDSTTQIPAQYRKAGPLMACNECDRLWEEYGDAMKKVGAIEGAVRFAKLQEDSVGIAITEAQLGDALWKQTEARRRLINHERTHTALKGAGDR